MSILQRVPTEGHTIVQGSVARSSDRKWFFGTIVLLLLGATLVQVALFMRLPYKTSDLEWVSEAGTSPPTPNFRIGSVTWDVEAYAQDPTLEPYRRLFDETCPNESGLAAAEKLGAHLRKTIPIGSPRLDFHNPRYDALESLKAHLEQGEPGHCVPYSGLLATTLLARGCPARVVSLLSPFGQGHTCVEVWDAEAGWVIVDPTHSVLVFTNVIARADKAGQSYAPFILRPYNGKRDNQVPEVVDIYSNRLDGFLQGNPIYPEPWLYTRCGKRFASWPYRGRYVVVGEPRWPYGPGQFWLKIGIGCSSCALVTSLIWGFLPRRRSNEQSAAHLPA